MEQRLYTTGFFAMAAANFFVSASYGSLFVFPLFVTELGGVKSDIGIVMGSFTLASVFCRPWISELVDRLGRKRCYTLGSLIMTAVPLFYLGLDGGNLGSVYIPLLLARVCHGVGLALCFTAAFTFIADIVPQHRLNEGIGMFGVSGLVGLALGPVIGEIVVQRSGFEMFFFASSCLGLAGLLGHLPVTDSFRYRPTVKSVGFFAVVSRKKMHLIAEMSFLFGFGLAAAGGFVFPFARERLLQFASFYYIAYSSAAIMARVFGGRFVDRVGEGRVIPYALALSGGGFLFLILLGSTPILVVSGFLSGLGHGFLFPCLNALAVRNEPVEIRGKITGIFTGAIDGGVFVGSILLGYVGEWTGYPSLFLVAGISLLLGLGVFQMQRHFLAEAA